MFPHVAKHRPVASGEFPIVDHKTRVEPIYMTNDLVLETGSSLFPGGSVAFQVVQGLVDATGWTVWATMPFLEKLGYDAFASTSSVLKLPSFHVFRL
ncbi:MAG: hypothetical protein R6U51_12240 [Anaerolineales bacterium]